MGQTGEIPTARPIDEAAYIDRSPDRMTASDWTRSALGFGVAGAVVWLLFPRWWLILGIGAVMAGITVFRDLRVRRGSRSTT